ncbi:hypothetical protein V498_03864, partial [Pseudogymnoascus sp. VKM F-4517 (FW-2822)]
YTEDLPRGPGVPRLRQLLPALYRAIFLCCGPIDRPYERRQSWQADRTLRVGRGTAERVRSPQRSLHHSPNTGPLRPKPQDQARDRFLWVWASWESVPVRGPARRKGCMAPSRVLQQEAGTGGIELRGPRPGAPSDREIL